jgi:hypothetical protein
MSTITQTVNSSAGRKPKVLTAQEKRIEELKKLRSNDKSTPAQDEEYAKLTADKLKSDLSRLGTARTAKALKAIQQLKNLARFKPSENQRKKVFTAIKDAVESAHTAWEGNKATESDGFVLDKE